MAQPAAVQIKAGRALIGGDLIIPARTTGLVLLSHGSGSSRFSRRNRSVAQTLRGGGFATLLLDLLTRQEDVIDQQTREYRFDVDRLGTAPLLQSTGLLAIQRWPGYPSLVSAPARVLPQH